MSAPAVDVAIVDSGANYASVCGALKRLGASYEVTADAERLRAAPRVILPGVGDAGDTWRRLVAYRLPDVLRELRQPLLGICVGMQVMFDYCEEAGVETLGLFAGRVSKLPSDPALRVPHCGWNQLDCDRDEPLFEAFAEAPPPYAYFVHSYAAPVTDATVARCTHGTTFAAAVRRGNVCGVQFHPERSAATGRAILQRFLAMSDH